MLGLIALFAKPNVLTQETLSIFYKGKNIYDVLEMDVAEAFEFFANIPSIQA